MFVVSSYGYDSRLFYFQLPPNIPAQIFSTAEVGVPEEICQDYNSNVAACSGGRGCDW